MSTLQGSSWVGSDAEPTCSSAVAYSDRCIVPVRIPEAGWAVVVTGVAAAVSPGVVPRSCMLEVTVGADGRLMTSFRMCPAVGVAVLVLPSLEPID